MGRVLSAAQKIALEKERQAAEGLQGKQKKDRKKKTGFAAAFESKSEEDCKNC